MFADADIQNRATLALSTGCSIAKPRRCSRGERVCLCLLKRFPNSLNVRTPNGYDACVNFLRHHLVFGGERRSDVHLWTAFPWSECRPPHESHLRHRTFGHRTPFSIESPALTYPPSLQILKTLRRPKSASRRKNSTRRKNSEC